MIPLACETQSHVAPMFQLQNHCRRLRLSNWLNDLGMLTPGQLIFAMEGTRSLPTHAIVFCNLLSEMESTVLKSFHVQSWSSWNFRLVTLKPSGLRVAVGATTGGRRIMRFNFILQKRWQGSMSPSINSTRLRCRRHTC